MKYTKEQRLDIGRRIYYSEISRYEAALSIYIIAKCRVTSCRERGLGAGDWGLGSRKSGAVNRDREPAADSRKPEANS